MCPVNAMWGGVLESALLLTCCLKRLPSAEVQLRHAHIAAVAV